MWRGEVERELVLTRGGAARQKKFCGLALLSRVARVLPPRNAGFSSARRASRTAAAEMPTRRTDGSAGAAVGARGANLIISRSDALNVPAAALSASKGEDAVKRGRALAAPPQDPVFATNARPSLANRRRVETPGTQQARRRRRRQCRRRQCCRRPPSRDDPAASRAALARRAGGEAPRSCWHQSPATDLYMTSPVLCVIAPLCDDEIMVCRLAHFWQRARFLRRGAIDGSGTCRPPAGTPARSRAAAANAANALAKRPSSLGAPRPSVVVKRSIARPHQTSPHPRYGTAPIRDKGQTRAVARGAPLLLSPDADSQQA